MMISRLAVRSMRNRNVASGARCFSSKQVAAAADKKTDVANPAAEKREEMAKIDVHMVWGRPDSSLRAPRLPEQPKEIAALDPVSNGNLAASTMMDGSTRTVIIRQQKKSTRQAPLNPESSWQIFFYEDGMITEKWTNSLMGWTSNADPYQFAPPLQFSNAQEAVYFAKKRGWKYIVRPPILRPVRSDDAQYQDNFLPQAVAKRVKMEGTSCAEWERKASGASHYFRPLKYHGNGTVPQFGPNANAKVAPHVEGSYKLR
jgi:ETC complex I subunit conserved region